jgi:hypothetical protein
MTADKMTADKMTVGKMTYFSVRVSKNNDGETIINVVTLYLQKKALQLARMPGMAG